MKRTVLLLIAALALTMVSCKQVEMPFTHEDSDVKITSMLMWNIPYKAIDSSSKFNIRESVAAKITHNAPDEIGEIVFIVPRNKRTLWDLTDVTLEATVFYDLYITPSLAGHHDVTLDDEDNARLVLTVKSARTGFEKKYNVHAEISYE